MWGILHKDVCIFKVVSGSILLGMGNILDRFVNKIKPHFIFNNIFSENRSVYKIT